MGRLDFAPDAGGHHTESTVCTTAANEKCRLRCTLEPQEHAPANHGQSAQVPHQAPKQARGPSRGTGTPLAAAAGTAASAGTGASHEASSRSHLPLHRTFIDLPCETIPRKVKTNADFMGFRRPLSRRKLRDPYSPSAASYSPSRLVVERGPGCHSHGQVCMTKHWFAGFFCRVFCKVFCRVFARCFARWSTVFCRAKLLHNTIQWEYRAKHTLAAHLLQHPRVEHVGHLPHCSSRISRHAC